MITTPPYALRHCARQQQGRETGSSWITCGPFTGENREVEERYLNPDASMRTSAMLVHGVKGQLSDRRWSECSHPESMVAEFERLAAFAAWTGATLGSPTPVGRRSSRFPNHGRFRTEYSHARSNQ